MTRAIEAHGITVRRGGTVAVDSVSLSVEPSNWFGIIGANGSGKTSLLRALCGRLPATMEQCVINGRDLTNAPVERARAIGFMVPAEALPGALTCHQIFKLIDPDKAQWALKIGPIWDAVGVEQLLPRRIATCSAGMRQRIAIAAAFLAGDGLVVLDEPFNWLDPVAAMDVRLAIRAHVATGRTVVTALHDMMTMAACDAGVLMGQGRIVKVLDGSDIAVGRERPFDFEKAIIAELRTNNVGFT